MKLINFNDIFMILSVIYLCNTVNCDDSNEKDMLAKQKLIANILTNMQQCTEETEVKIDLFQLFDQSQSSPDKKKFVTCMMRKFGWLDSNDKLSIDGLKAMAHDMTDGNQEIIDAMEEIGNKCSTSHDPDMYENAYKYYHCIMNEVELRNINFGI